MLSQKQMIVSATMMLVLVFAAGAGGLLYSKKKRQQQEEEAARITWKATDARLLGYRNDGERPDAPTVGCYATNGKDCEILASRAAYEAAALTLTDAAPMLWCGKAHTAAWGMPGYGTPDHWCDTPL